MAQEELTPAEAGEAAYWNRLEEQHYQEELSRFNASAEFARSQGLTSKSPEADGDEEPPPRSTHGEDADT